MERKLQKMYLTYYNRPRPRLLIDQYLCQAHYQILLMIFLKEFIELKCKFGYNDKKIKLMKLNISIATVFLNT